jgi:hypothetical protein
MLASCATHSATISSYVDPTLQRGLIQSIAVFPVVNTRMAPSEAQQVNRRVSFVIHQRDPQIELMSSVEAIDRLNEYGLADDWAVFLQNYVSSGVPDATVLGEIGSALGVDAIIQGEVLDLYQQDGDADGRKGVTRVTVRFSMLDCLNGKLLWEASSDGRRETAIGGTLAHAPPVIEAIQLAVDKILESLPL